MQTWVMLIKRSCLGNNFIWNCRPAQFYSVLNVCCFPKETPLMRTNSLVYLHVDFITAFLHVSNAITVVIRETWCKGFLACLQRGRSPCPLWIIILSTFLLQGFSIHSICFSPVITLFAVSPHTASLSFFASKPIHFFLRFHNRDFAYIAICVWLHHLYKSSTPPFPSLFNSVSILHNIIIIMHLINLFPASITQTPTRSHQEWWWSHCAVNWQSLQYGPLFFLTSGKPSKW